MILSHNPSRAAVLHTGKPPSNERFSPPWIVCTRCLFQRHRGLGIRYLAIGYPSTEATADRLIVKRFRRLYLYLDYPIRSGIIVSFVTYAPLTADGPKIHWVDCINSPCIV